MSGARRLVKAEFQSDPLEEVILQNIKSMLLMRDWGVWRTHGNMYQSGWPDLYAAHHQHGARWIEVKRPTGYRFTPAQVKMFPEMHSRGIGVWVLWEATDDAYQKLFKPCNFHWCFMGQLV